VNDVNRIQERQGAYVAGGVALSAGVFRTAIVLLLIAAGIRAGYCLVGVGSDQGLIARLGDDAEYDWHARNLLAGRGMVSLNGRPTAQRTPGYPLFLAAVYGACGHSYVAVRMAQSVLGGVSCALLYLLVRRWFPGPSGLISASILAVYPMHIWLAGVLLSENLAIPGLLLVLLLLTRLNGTGRRWVWGVTGLAAGCLGLIHPILAGLGAVLCGIVVLTGSFDRNRRMACAVALIGAFSVPLSGWMMRNRTAVGGLVLSSLGGKTFLGANNIITVTWPREYGYWVSEWSPPGVREQIGGVEDELARDALFFRFGVRWLLENPRYWPRLAAFKTFRFYAPILHEWRSVEGLAYLGSYGLLLPFVLTGIWKTVRLRWSADRETLRLAVAVIVYYTAMVVVFWGAPRFRQTIDPLLIGFASIAILHALHALRRASALVGPPRWQLSGNAV
jgi:4-amino-4-deoxy-L-arabinose transferase-like glycosyltransferase